MSTKNNGKSIDYNMASALGVMVLKKAENIKSQNGYVEFDISNYPYQIKNIKDMVGKEGYIALNKVTIDSFEKEEHLFFTGFLNDGRPLDEDILEKMFRLNTFEKECVLNGDIISSLMDNAKQYAKKVLIESEEKNNKLLNDEIIKINKWADDKIESVQLKVEMMRNERKNLQKQSDIAENTFEKKQIEEAILKLSKKIKQSWLELADAEEEIESQRKSMIQKLRNQLMKSSNLENIFSIAFKIV